MKWPNWRLFFLLNDIKLGISILALIGIVILSIFIFDKAFPIFKYSVLCLKIVTWICLILSLAILFAMVRKTRKERFCSFSNRRKIVYCLSYLFLSLTFLFSIEYLIYIDNKKYFNIENGYINNSLIDKVNTIHENIAYCEEYIHEYNKILRNIKSYSYIHYLNSDDLFYTIICSDTIQLRLHRKNPSGGGMIHNRFEKHKRLFEGVRGVGRHYKIFCVNGNTGFRNESRIFYFIHLQNEKDYERKKSSSA